MQVASVNKFTTQVDSWAFVVFYKMYKKIFHSSEGPTLFAIFIINKYDDLA